MDEFRMVPERDADGPTRRVYEEILKVKHLHKLPHFFQTLANSTPVLQGTWSVYCDVSTRGLVSEVLKEMIFVAISAVTECKYCEAAHLAFCRILKVDAETCENLVHNIDALEPLRTRNIVRFAVKAGTEPKSMVKADYDALRKEGLSDEEIIEIVAMSAFARYAITIAEALKLDVDHWE
jgi:uncharacterized peroxidase-related enzyme